jgi:hypothetical protein
MSWWDSYRAVYGAELRAAAREFSDHGWPAVAGAPEGILLVTGTVLDVLEVPAECGRRVCAQLRQAGIVVPVAATPAGSWWFPVTAGATLPAGLRRRAEVVLHAAGTAVLAPPSELPDGWVHWRVAPALSGYRLPTADMIIDAVADSARCRTDHDGRPGAQRPVAAVVVGMRS